MKSIRAFLCLCTCLYAASLLVAQPDSAPAKTTFRLIAAYGTYHDIYYDISPKQTRIPLSIGRGLSSPYGFPKSASLVVYRELAPPVDAPPGTAPARHVVLDTPMPAGGADCIIVVAPNGTGPQATLGSRVIPEPRNAHPAGMVRFINFSEYPLAVAAAKEQLSVPVGEVGSVRVNAGRVFFQAAVHRDGDWRSTFRAERRLDPRLRGYFFVFNYRDDPGAPPEPTPPPARVVDIFETVPTPVK